jgi:hypothetical protein
MVGRINVSTRPLLSPGAVVASRKFWASMFLIYVSYVSGVYVSQGGCSGLVWVWAFGPLTGLAEAGLRRLLRNRRLKRAAPEAHGAARFRRGLRSRSPCTQRAPAASGGGSLRSRGRGRRTAHPGTSLTIRSKKIARQKGKAPLLKPLTLTPYPPLRTAGSSLAFPPASLRCG